MECTKICQKPHGLTFTTPPTEEERVGSSAVKFKTEASELTLRGVSRGVAIFQDRVILLWQRVAGIKWNGEGEG